MIYKCGCKDLGERFVFCAKHALSEEKTSVDLAWTADYDQAKWSGYKVALVSGLKLIA